MATIAIALGFAALGKALGFVGLGLTAATAVGTALGSFIDNQFVLPAIFPPENVEGPRLAELRLTFAEEGAPHNLSFGATIRNNGAYIWTSDLIEIRRDEGGGGKGGKGSGGTIFSYEYFIDLALCYAFTDGNPMGNVNEVLANGKPIYKRGQIINVGPAIINSTTPLTVNQQPVWDLTMATIDLARFQPGGTVTVSGFANANNNGSFTVVSSSSNPGAGTSRLRLRYSPVSPPVVETGTGDEQVVQTVADFRATIMDGLEEYPGSPTQAPSPTIEAIEGTGQVSGWPGFAYVVIKRLFLNEFGATAPQINVINTPGTTATAGGMIEEIFKRAHVAGGTGDPITLDVSQAQAPSRGYVLQGILDVVKAIQPLMLAYNLVPQNTETGLRFFPKDEAVIIDVDPADLAAHEGSESTERPMVIEDPTPLALPEAVNVKYVDIETNYQSGDQQERAAEGGTEGSVLNINLPGLALEGVGSEARAIAKRVLYESYVSRKTVKFSLPFKYAGLQPNDMVRIPDTMGQDWLLLIQKVDRGDNFLLQFEAQEEILQTLTQVGTHESPLGVENRYPREIPFVEPMPFPPAPPPDDSTTVPPDTPFLLVPVYRGPGSQWYGAKILGRPEGSDEWNTLGTQTEEAWTGYGVDALGGDPVKDFNTRDDVNTVDIVLWAGSLESVTFEEIMQRGKNICILGEEVLAFETAALVDSRTYRLSNLWRGLRYTSGAINSHVVSENFILLSGPGIRGATHAISHTWLDRPTELKATTPGQDPESVPAQVTVQIRDGMLKPYPVTNPSVNHDSGGTGVIVARWDYVSKAYANTFGEGSAALTATDERYDLEITNGNLMVTKQVQENRLIYPKTEWEADGFSNGDDLSIDIFQVNLGMGGAGRGDGLQDGPLEVQNIQGGA